MSFDNASFLDLLSLHYCFFLLHKINGSSSPFRMGSRKENESTVK